MKAMTFKRNGPGIKAEEAYKNWHTTLDRRAMMADIDTVEYDDGGEPIGMVEVTTRPFNWHMPVALCTAQMCDVMAAKVILPTEDIIYDQGDDTLASVWVKHWPSLLKREGFSNPYPRATTITLGRWGKFLHWLHGIDDPMRQNENWNKFYSN